MSPSHYCSLPEVISQNAFHTLRPHCTVTTACCPFFHIGRSLSFLPLFLAQILWTHLLLLSLMVNVLSVTYTCYPAGRSYPPVNSAVIRADVAFLRSADLTERSRSPVFVRLVLKMRRSVYQKAFDVSVSVLIATNRSDSDDSSVSSTLWFRLALHESTARTCFQFG